MEIGRGGAFAAILPIGAGKQLNLHIDYLSTES